MIKREHFRSVLGPWMGADGARGAWAQARRAAGTPVEAPLVIAARIEPATACPAVKWVKRHQRAG